MNELHFFGPLWDPRQRDVLRWERTHTIEADAGDEFIHKVLAAHIDDPPPVLVRSLGMCGHRRHYSAHGLGQHRWQGAAGNSRGALPIQLSRPYECI
jgi:hypothetical protein